MQTFLMENGTIIVGGVQWQRGTERRLNDPDYLEGYNYKVYSQNGEDGIIAEIFRRIGTGSKRFVEFGVQNGLECNSHLLLLKNWGGMWIEGREASCADLRIRFEAVLREGRLKLINSFVTAENIDALITTHAGTDIDFLSIDIDGNDYWIWKEIISISPRVVCIEYNGKFPPDLDWKQNYDPDFIWDGSDWHGASLKALEKLGREKGYTLVATDLAGVNAFFVRDDLVGGLFPMPHTAEDLFNPLRFNVIECAGHPARYCLADTVHQKRIKNLCYAFPYGRVQKGSKVILWGAGDVGKSYVDQLLKSEWCEIIHIIDMKDAVNSYNGVDIVSPDDVDYTAADKYIISVLDEEIAKAIRVELINRGVKSADIIWSLKR